VNRRGFLRRSGLLAAGAMVGVAATASAEPLAEHSDDKVSGYAVGNHRPPELAATTIAWRWPTSEPIVALTIDDGPSLAYTARILDILDHKDVVATFFQMGKHVQALPALSQRAAQRHEIGNHTWSHPSMALGRPELISDPRFAEPASRAQNMEQLIPILDEAFLQRDSEHWRQTLAEYDIAFSVMPTYAEVASDPQMHANQIIVPLAHPRLGTIATISSPIQLEGREKQHATGAPELRAITPPCRFGVPLLNN